MRHIVGQDTERAGFGFVAEPLLSHGELCCLVEKLYLVMSLVRAYIPSWSGE